MEEDCVEDSCGRDGASVRERGGAKEVFITSHHIFYRRGVRKYFNDVLRRTTLFHCIDSLKHLLRL